MWHATEPGFPAFGALTAQPLPPPIPPDPAATPSKEEAFRAEVEARHLAMDEVGSTHIPRLLRRLHCRRLS